MSQKNFDTTRKFVRLVQIRSNDLVEFEFAIGEPELFAELILPRSAFDEFCKNNEVLMLTESVVADDLQSSRTISSDGLDWTLRQARQQRFK